MSRSASSIWRAIALASDIKTPKKAEVREAEWMKQWFFV